MLIRSYLYSFFKALFKAIFKAKTQKLQKVELPKDNWEFNPFYISLNGKILNRRNLNKVFLPTFEIYKSPSFTINSVSERRFKLIDLTGGLTGNYYYGNKKI